MLSITVRQSVCYLLQFGSHSVICYSSAVLRPADGPVWFGGVQCQGLEDNLLECGTSGWLIPPEDKDCANHTNDLVVSCYSDGRP